MREIFNDHYINLVEKSSGKKPTSLAKDTGTSDDRQIVRLIIEKYKNHPSILAIIQNPEQVMESFTFQEIDNTEVAHLLKTLDVLWVRLAALPVNDLAQPINQST